MPNGQQPRPKSCKKGRSNRTVSERALTVRKRPTTTPRRLQDTIRTLSGHYLDVHFDPTRTLNTMGFFARTLFQRLPFWTLSGHYPDTIRICRFACFSAVRLQICRFCFFFLANLQVLSFFPCRFATPGKGVYVLSKRAST